MSDTIKGRIKNAGRAVAGAAKKAGDKIRRGSDKTADRVAGAAKSAGERVRTAGQKLKDKSGT